jgi:hypothetical protein
MNQKPLYALIMVSAWTLITFAPATTHAQQADPDPSSAYHCIPSDEICDGIDNNCDDRIDEGYNFENDPDNCGMCGHACKSNQVCDHGFCTYFDRASCGELRLPCPNDTDCTRDGNCQPAVTWAPLEPQEPPAREKASADYIRWMTAPWVGNVLMALMVILALSLGIIILFVFRHNDQLQRENDLLRQQAERRRGW